MSHKFLVVRLGSLGDVLLTTGVLEWWHKTEGFRFHVATRAGFADIFKNHPAVERVVPIHPESLTFKGWWNFCRTLEKTFSPLEFIDLHGNLRTALLKKIWSARVHSYPKMGLIRRLYSRTGFSVLKNRLLELNVPQRYVLALSKKVPEKMELVPRIFLEPSERENAWNLLAPLGQPGKIICLHPYATHQAKAWPPEKWKRLITIFESQGIDWIITGQDPCPLFPSSSRDFTNRTGIRETAALISNCLALVTGDSGPMHLACAAGTPVIGLFGPTGREWGFYPSGPDDIVLEKDLGCRPCSLHGKSAGKCRAKCMDLIQPEEVLQAVNSLRT
jgi:ADP-heptose:LPS heptosyltransferase